MIVQAEFVAGYWELIPMESGAGLLAPQDTYKARVAKDRPEAKKQNTLWWTEENCQYIYIDTFLYKIVHIQI